VTVVHVHPDARARTICPPYAFRQLHSYGDTDAQSPAATSRTTSRHVRTRFPGPLHAREKHGQLCLSTRRLPYSSPITEERTTEVPVAATFSPYPLHFPFSSFRTANQLNPQRTHTFSSNTDAMFFLARPNMRASELLLPNRARSRDRCPTTARLGLVGSFVRGSS